MFTSDTYGSYQVLDVHFWHVWELSSPWCSLLTRMRVKSLMFTSDTYGSYQVLDVYFWHVCHLVSCSNYYCRGRPVDPNGWHHIRLSRRCGCSALMAELDFPVWWPISLISRWGFTVRWNDPLLVANRTSLYVPGDSNKHVKYPRFLFHYLSWKLLFLIRFHQVHPAAASWLEKLVNNKNYRAFQITVNQLNDAVSHFV